MLSAIRICARVSTLAIAVAILFAPSVASSARADDYKRDPMVKEFNTWNKMINSKEAKEVKNLVTGVGGMTLAGNENMLISFMNDTFFPLFTQPENAVGMESPGRYGLAKMHDQYKKQLLMASATANQAGVHEVLNKVTLKKMADIVNNNYHPAVRYQAMLMLGDLHEVEPKGRAAGTLLPVALPYLLAGAKKQDFPYEVRVAALVGVQKHAQNNATGGNKKKEIAEAMKSVLAEKTPPEGRSQELQDWLRQMAADVMTTIREPIPDDLKIQPKTVAATDTAAK